MKTKRIVGSLTMDTTSFDGTCFESGIDLLQPIEQDEHQFASFVRTDTCPSLASSFLTIDTSRMSFEDGRRSSFSSQSMSPGHFTASAGSIPSPATPITFQPAYENVWTKPSMKGVWHSAYADANQLWWASHDPSFDSLQLNCYSRPCSTLHEKAELGVLTQPPPNTEDRTMSTVAFVDSSPEITRSHADNMLTWSAPGMAVQPQTIEPSATFQSVGPSSPLSKFEPITPLTHRADSMLLDSSPFSSVPSSVVPSQYESDGSTYRGCTFDSFPTPKLVRSQIRHKNLLKRESPDRRKSPPAKSGLNCEAVIPQNEYPCTWPGCVDKETGKARRFKRQEHRKRHEHTVHEKRSYFRCWVVTGGKACGKEFTRNDNLQSHLKKTHGRKSNNQRNPYVATQDPDSKYHDPKWTGPCTSDGLPIGHPLWPDLA